MGADPAKGELAELVRLTEEGFMVTLVGPTASGKTELAVRLADRIGGEVVSADSVQVYRRFDVGSGKPLPGELALAKHHLIDVLEPHDPIDAAVYADLATKAIVDIRARGKHPIVCGGTFLWVKALLYGLAEGPAANSAIRQRHQAIADTQGRAELHRLLAEVDPGSAARLHPNDLVRVGRALEVFEVTGRTMTALQGAHAFRVPRHKAHLVARNVTPEALTKNITHRVEAWLTAGWVDEVARLVRDGYGAARAMGSVGYREVHAHVVGELPREVLAERIVRATRVFARRQRTWLNHAEVIWLDSS